MRIQSASGTDPSLQNFLHVKIFLAKIVQLFGLAEVEEGGGSSKEHSWRHQ
jgi:hypothetical protein